MDHHHVTQSNLPRGRGAQNALQEGHATPASEEKQRENAVHVVVLFSHRQVVACGAIRKKGMVRGLKYRRQAKEH